MEVSRKIVYMNDDDHDDDKDNECHHDNDVNDKCIKDNYYIYYDTDECVPCTQLIFILNPS